MRFSELARYLEKLEATSSRNDITRLLADLFGRTGAGEIGKACYLLLGELVPAYRGIEFNIAEKMMLQVIARAYGRDPDEVSRLYKREGDHGNIAYLFAGKQATHRGAALDISAVYERLLAIAEHAGMGSQERKVTGFADLLSALDPLSAKFVARIPVGKLRLGFSEMTILDALSVMLVGDKSARRRIEAAYNITADIGALALRLKTRGLSSLTRLAATPGIPIRPSLAERLRTVEDVIVKAGPVVAVEPKLDGFRTQIHVWQNGRSRRVALFSRNLENTTAMFPEIARAAKSLKIKSVILDAEAIGFNAKTGAYAPFQETAQRKRKHDIEAFAKKIPLVGLVFDVLYLNGKSLLSLSQRKRRKILEHLFREDASEGVLRIDPQRITDDPNVIAAELDANVKRGLEGLVVKNLGSPYQAGSRGFHWIKLKATMAALEGLRAGPPTKSSGGGAGKRHGMMQLPDTIDCVVMGAYKGRGKRAGFGVGGFLIGVRAGERYYSLSRLGSGLSDEQFREMNIRVGKLQSGSPPKEYVLLKDVAPDIWVRPKLVVEILADEISLSSRYTVGRKGEERTAPTRRGGLRPAGRGYSLRFPRLVRFRDDKDPDEATTVAEVAHMYKLQRRR